MLAQACSATTCLQRELEVERLAKLHSIALPDRPIDRPNPSDAMRYAGTCPSIHRREREAARPGNRSRCQVSRELGKAFPHGAPLPSRSLAQPCGGRAGTRCCRAHRARRTRRCTCRALAQRNADGRLRDPCTGPTRMRKRSAMASRLPPGRTVAYCWPCEEMSATTSVRSATSSSLSGCCCCLARGAEPALPIQSCATCSSTSTSKSSKLRGTATALGRPSFATGSSSRCLAITLARESHRTPC